MTTTYRPKVIDYRLAPSWLGDEIDGERVIAWRLTKNIGVYLAQDVSDWHYQDWHYQIITDGSIYTAKVDGTLISQGSLNLV
jgi:hypothetical protein